MGYRTIVSLNNDYSWQRDDRLASKISIAASNMQRKPDMHVSDGISVHEVVHADTVTLAKLSFYHGFNTFAHTRWDNDDQDITLLKEAAKARGYRLVKI